MLTLAQPLVMPLESQALLFFQIFFFNFFWFGMASVTEKLLRRCKSFEYILSGFLSLNTSIKRKNFELILLIKQFSLALCQFVHMCICAVQNPAHASLPLVLRSPSVSLSCQWLGYLLVYQGFDISGRMLVGYFTE